MIIDEITRAPKSSHATPLAALQAGVAQANELARTRILSIFAIFTPFTVRGAEKSAFGANLAASILICLGPGGTATWTGVNSGDNVYLRSVE